MSISIKPRSRDISHIRVQVQRLWISKVSIGHSGGLSGPVWRDEPPKSIRVISGPKVIQAGFRIAFFAAEFVVVRITIDELEFATPGIIIRFGFDVAGGVGDYRGGLQI